MTRVNLRHSDMQFHVVDIYLLLCRTVSFRSDAHSRELHTSGQLCNLKLVKPAHDWATTAMPCPVTLPHLMSSRDLKQPTCTEHPVRQVPAHPTMTALHKQCVSSCGNNTHVWNETAGTGTVQAEISQHRTSKQHGRPGFRRCHKHKLRFTS